MGLKRGDSVLCHDGRGGGETMVVHFCWEDGIGQMAALLRPRFSPNAEFFPVRLATPAPSSLFPTRSFREVA